MSRHPFRTAARTSALLVAALVGTLLLATPAQATSWEPATDLDDGCFALRVTTTGTTAGANNHVERASVGYGTRGTAANAEPIAFEATRLGGYRLYDTQGGALYRSILGYVWAGSSYGAEADWTVTRSGDDYRIASTGGGQLIGSVSGKLTLSSASFRLVPTTGCHQVASTTTGMLSAPTAAPVNADGTLNGFIDAHAHPVAAAGFGGDFVCGEPFAAGGPEVALAGCASHAAGAGALFEAIIGGSDISLSDDGWPTFGDWPTTSSLLHEGAYYTSIERAWQSGMRVFNALLVGNRVICELYDGSAECDEMQQIRAQAALLYEMQDYIDAQSGGPGLGWFRIAVTPEEVRAIAADGKLAVTIGVEMSEMFGCRVIGGVAQCTEADVDAGLAEFAALGVSGLYPVHKFDNAFGGTRFDPGVTGAALNIGNKISTGQWWQAESCTGPSDNEQAIVSDEIVALLAQITELPAGTTVPVYPSGPICNVRGLTPLGEHLIDGMMDRGMVIHIDHMGVRTAQAVLDIAEDAGYPGITSVHTWSDRAITARIAQAGGFVASYAYSASDAGNDEPDFLAEWVANRAEAGPGVLTAYGYGSDVNGLAPQPGARLDAGTAPLGYPFTALNGAVFDRQQLGTRVFDLNIDGVAQYGLYADWSADIVQRATATLGAAEAQLLRSQLMGGAEAYVQMWEGSLG